MLTRVERRSFGRHVTYIATPFWSTDSPRGTAHPKSDRIFHNPRIVESNLLLRIVTQLGFVLLILPSRNYSVHLR
jgi:hypothetical protein